MPNGSVLPPSKGDWSPVLDKKSSRAKIKALENELDIHRLAITLIYEIVSAVVVESAKLDKGVS